MTARLVAVLLVVAASRVWRPRSAARPRSSSSGLRASPRSLARVPAARPAVVLLAVTAGLSLGGPVVGALAGVAGWSVVPLGAHLERRRSRTAVAAAVPDLVDLFLVSASAGQPVAGALGVVAPRAPEAVAPAVSAADHRFRRGLPLDECLGDLGGALGTEGAPLADALRQAAATGVPLVPLLSAVAAAARDGRRRRAQEVARRLPVTMLFPLVACVLPAAVALAVVPVLLVSVSSLSP